MEIRWGGWPGTRDGNSRTKSFSSSVLVPWTSRLGRKRDTAERTWDLACSSLSWVARKKGFWRRAIATASSSVRTIAGGDSWAARNAGPRAASITRISKPDVRLMSNLLAGLFGVPDPFENEPRQDIGRAGRKLGVPLPEAHVGITLEHGLDEGCDLTGVQAPELPRSDALCEDAGAYDDELLALLLEHGQHLPVRLQRGAGLAGRRSKDPHELEHGLVHPQDAVDLLHVFAALEDDLDEPPDLVAGAPRGVDDPGEPLPNVVERMPQDLEEQGPFAGDIFIDRRLGELGLPGDVVHRQGAVALAHDDARGGVQDDVPVAFATADLALAADLACSHCF